MSKKEKEIKERKTAGHGRPAMRLSDYLQYEGGKVLNGVFITFFVCLALMLYMSSFTGRLLTGPYEYTKEALHVNTSIESAEAYLYEAIAADEKSVIDIASANASSAIKAAITNQDVLIAKLGDNLELLAMANDISRLIDDYASNCEGSIQSLLYNTDDSAALALMSEKIVPLSQEISAEINKFVELSDSKGTIIKKSTINWQIIAGVFMLIAIMMVYRGSKNSTRREVKNILAPTKLITDANVGLSHGQTDFVIDYHQDDEFNDLADTSRAIGKTLNALLDELNNLVAGIERGQLATRANPDNFEGAYKDLVNGINNTLDNVINPLNTTSAALERISRGDIPESFDYEAVGDFVEIRNNLNKCLSSIHALIDDTNMVEDSAIRGRLRDRADVSRHNGQFAELMNGINNIADTFVSHIDVLPSAVTIIDRSFHVQYVNKKAADMMGTTVDAIEGKKRCFECVNSSVCRTKECVCANAMRTNSNVFGEASANPPISGMHLETTHTGIPLHDKEGNVIGGIELLTDETPIITALHQVEEEQRVVKEVNDYQTVEVSNLIDRLNKVADGDLDISFETQEATSKSVSKVHSDFTLINSNLEKVVHAVRSLVDDSASLANAAVEGNLSKRIDESKHHGEYSRVASGINNTLDAVLEPIAETLSVLQEVAKGNLQMEVTGDYKGEHAKMKIALNSTIMNLRATINEISEILTAIGEGDLTVEINGHYDGDFIQIKDSLEEILAQLSDVMSNLNTTSNQVANSSRQLSDAATSLADGSTQQASAIEQLTASITRISSQTVGNAEDASKASTLSNNVKLSAQRGDKQMKAMLKSMDEINESSANISKIIKVIDDIAFQTNILALNAAVEAARAGIHGKGFAVVADEVRNLAAKSAEAASETTSLIEGSITAVAEGTRIANETASALEEIVSGIEEAADLVAGIAVASNEQAEAIDHIDKGIEQVSEVVRSNSATAQESAAASEELYGQADILKNMVAKFEIPEDDDFEGFQFDFAAYDDDDLAYDGDEDYEDEDYEDEDEIKAIPQIEL